MGNIAPFVVSLFFHSIALGAADCDTTAIKSYQDKTIEEQKLEGIDRERFLADVGDLLIHKLLLCVSQGKQITEQDLETARKIVKKRRIEKIARIKARESKALEWQKHSEQGSEKFQISQWVIHSTSIDIAHAENDIRRLTRILGINLKNP